MSFLMNLLTNQFYKLILGCRLWLAHLKGVELGQYVRLGPRVDFNLGGGFRNSLRPTGTRGQIRIGDLS